MAQSGYCGPKGRRFVSAVLGLAGSIFLLLSGGQKTSHKHDENNDQPHHLSGNAGDHEFNIDSADVNNEQKMR